MKRIIALGMSLLLLTGSLTGCGQGQPTEPPATADGETPQTEPTAQLPNSMEEVTEEELAERAGLSLPVPADAQDCTYTYIDGTGIAQVDFTTDGRNWCLRGKLTDDPAEDISGMYYDWTTPEHQPEDASCAIYLSDTQQGICTWRDNGANYCLILTENASEEALAQMYRQLTGTAGETAGLVGVGYESVDGAYLDDWGVKLSAEQITADGLTLVCEFASEEGNVTTGSPYTLEVRKHGVWEAVPLLDPEQELMWTEEAWLLTANGVTRWPVSWEALYGSLPAGRYRIGKTFWGGSGEGSQRAYYAEFELMDSEEPIISSYHDALRMGLPYVSGWEYGVETYGTAITGFGLRFRPVGTEGWIQLLRYEDPFGVCGTGLETEQVTLDNGVEVTQGTYDNRSVWDFMTWENGSHLVAQTDTGVADWWDQYGAQAMKILSGATLEDATDSAG